MAHNEFDNCILDLQKQLHTVKNIQGKINNDISQFNYKTALIKEEIKEKSSNIAECIEEIEQLKIKNFDVLLHTIKAELDLKNEKDCISRYSEKMNSLEHFSKQQLVFCENNSVDNEFSTTFSLQNDKTKLIDEIEKLKYTHSMLKKRNAAKLLKESKSLAEHEKLKNEIKKLGK